MENSIFINRLRLEPELSVNALLTMLGGSEQACERVIRLTARLMPGHIGRLQDALAEGPDRCRAEAHSIKGALCSIGALSLGAAAQELERSAADGDTDEAGAFIEALTAFTERLLVLTGDVQDKPPGDLSELPGYLADISDAAAIFDCPSAQRILASVRSRTYGKGWDSRLAELAALFDEYNITGAVKLLNELKVRILPDGKI